MISYLQIVENYQKIRYKAQSNLALAEKLNDTRYDDYYDQIRDYQLSLINENDKINRQNVTMYTFAINPNLCVNCFKETEKLFSYYREDNMLEKELITQLVEPSSVISKFGKAFTTDDEHGYYIKEEANLWELANEEFTGIFGTNKLREYMPWYAYIYGVTNCRYQDNVNRVVNCTKSLNIIYEMVPGRTLEEIVINDYKDFIEIFYQLLLILHFGNKIIGFVHYDLHPGNILVEELPYIVDNYYRNPVENNYYVVKSKWRLRLIDFGRSRIKYTSNNKERINYIPGYDMFNINKQNNIAHDIFKVIMFSYVRRKNLKLTYDKLLISLFNIDPTSITDKLLNKNKYFMVDNSFLHLKSEDFITNTYNVFINDIDMRMSDTKVLEIPIDVDYDTVDLEADGYYFYINNVDPGSYKSSDLLRTINSFLKIYKNPDKVFITSWFMAKYHERLNELISENIQTSEISILKNLLSFI